MIFSDFPNGTVFVQDTCACAFAMHRRTVNDRCFIALTRTTRCTWDACQYEDRPIEVDDDEEITPFRVKASVGQVVKSPLLRSLERDVAAFHAQPTWAAWKQLRRRHTKYMSTHILFPGNSYELDTIRAMWKVVCDGPFLVFGWTRNDFINAANALAAGGTLIPMMVPDFIGAQLVKITVSGNGDCSSVALANDAIGGMMMEHGELVTWLHPVLASHAVVKQ